MRNDYAGKNTTPPKRGNDWIWGLAGLVCWLLFLAMVWGAV